MVGRGSRQTDRRVKGLQVRQKERGGRGKRGRGEEEEEKKDERSGVCCSQRRRFVRHKSGTVRPSFSSPPSQHPTLLLTPCLALSSHLLTLKTTISHVRYYQRLHSAWPVNQPALCPQGALGSPEVWLTLTRRRRFCPKASLFLQLVSLFIVLRCLIFSISWLHILNVDAGKKLTPILSSDSLLCSARHLYYHLLLSA